MGILRWVCGSTRNDKDINKHIRRTAIVVQASETVTKNNRMLKWDWRDYYRRITHSEEDDDVKGRADDQ